MTDYNYCEYSSNSRSDYIDRMWEGEDEETKAAEEAVFVASYIEKVDRYYR